MSDLDPFDELLFFGSLDYGYADEFSFSLWAVNRHGIHRNLGGIYEKYLDATEQAKKIRDVCDWWGVRPLEIAADNQINNQTGIKNKQTGHVVRIIDEYYDVLGPDWTVFRTERNDKIDPASKRNKAIQMFKTGQLQFLNHQDSTPFPCLPKIQEIQKLQYKAGRQDMVTSPDHFDAELRYYVAADYGFDTWFKGGGGELKTYKRPDDEPNY
jgi:hypothetical protein